MSRVIADGLSKRGQQESVGQFGLGNNNNLSGTVFETGIPSDIYSTGATIGFASGGALGIPGLVASAYVILLSNSQWGDSTGKRASAQRTALYGDRLFVQFSTNDTTWGAWKEVYTQASILGTVSQSAGVPTGAIIERGSNANGEYVKFADGTLICTREQLIDVTDATFQLFTMPVAPIAGRKNAVSFGAVTHVNAALQYSNIESFQTINTQWAILLKTAGTVGGTVENDTLILQSFGRWW